MQARKSFSWSTLIAAGAGVLVAGGLIALLVPAWYAQRVAALKAERGWSATPAETLQIKSAQAARLADYAWIDREKGVVALPIERAMELLAAESAAAPGVGGKR